jgi:hypothetical protein
MPASSGKPQALFRASFVRCSSNWCSRAFMYSKDVRFTASACTGSLVPSERKLLTRFTSRGRSRTRSSYRSTRVSSERLWRHHDTRCSAKPAFSRSEDGVPLESQKA